MSQTFISTDPIRPAEQVLWPPHAQPKRDWLVMGLLAIAAVMLLWRLGNGLLWQDEAETALLARHTLRFGYPRAFDGHSYIDPGPNGYGPGQAWIYSPWLPFYFLAAIFSVTGESTAIARLPFALFGLLSVYFTWRLARRVTTHRTTHRLSVALLAFSVPFVLHMRQCRYYALGTTLVLGVCLAALAFQRTPSIKRSALLGCILVLLFHTNFGTFVPSFAAVCGHQWLWGTPAARKRFWAIAAAVMAMTLPWMLFFYRSGFVGTFSLGRAGRHLQYYVRTTNKHLIPIAFMAATSIAWWLIQRRTPETRSTQRPDGRLSAEHLAAVRLLTLMAMAHVAFLLIPDQRHMRYLIQILPLLFIGEAWWLSQVFGWKRWVGWIVASLAISTNLLHSPRLNIPLADYAYELTHRYAGPMEGIVDFLRTHGRNTDTAKIPYDERTLLFYTQLTIEPPAQFLQESYPDWIIIRRDWIPREFFEGDYFRRIEASYDRIELDAPDILWQNREDPGSHHFRTVQHAPHIVLYRKRPMSNG